MFNLSCNSFLQPMIVIVGGTEGVDGSLTRPFRLCMPGPTQTFTHGSLSMANGRALFFMLIAVCHAKS